MRFNPSLSLSLSLSLMHAHTHTHSQFNRPLTLCKDTIQTRNRKSNGGKSKKKGKKSSTIASLHTNPLEAAAAAAAGRHNYIIAKTQGAFPSPPATAHDGIAAHYATDPSLFPTYAACSYPPAYASNGYPCDGYAAQCPEDIKPHVVSTTSAFNIVPPNSACYSPASSTSTPGIHSSPQSAFSPFASDHSNSNNSPLQPTTPQPSAHSPLM